MIKTSFWVLILSYYINLQKLLGNVKPKFTLTYIQDGLPPVHWHICTDYVEVQ
jgi:hypothetical protein